MRATAIPQTSALPLIGSAAPDPQAAPRAPAPTNGTKSFASLLRQNRPPPAAPPAAQAPRPDAALRSPDAAPADDARAAAPKPRPRSTEKTSAPAPKPAEPAHPASAKPESDGEQVADGSAAAGSKASAGTETLDHPVAPDPSLAQFLAHLHLPPEATRADDGGSAIDADADADATTTLSGRTAAAATTAADAARDARTEARATPADGAGAAAAGVVPFGVETAAAAAMATERRRLEPSPAVPSADGVGAPGALANLGAAPPPTAGSTVADALPVALATPVDSPDFPHMLGVQLSVLADGGVQHAELHLNPADMGPVSVQITMDGTAARIDFGVDVAATRQAIEAGLPELAGALRDAGFTLTGGGVSEHASGGRQSGGDADAGPRGGQGAGAEAEPATLLRRTVTAGGLDLYA